MNVYVYKGGLRLVKKSGVGKAVFHQIGILEKKGISVNKVSLSHSDIVHINTILPDSVFVAVIAKMIGIKVVWYGHSTMEDFKNSFIGSNLFAPLFKRWIMFCYGLGDAIITPTEYSGKILLNYGIRKPIFALSNGIDVNFWESNRNQNAVLRQIFLKKYGIPDEKEIIMSVGHYIERKGIIEFIDVARDNPEYTFVWFGYTPLNIVPSKIKDAIMHAPDNLILAGYVESEELKKAYEYCDLFLFMSHEETEGIAVLESMACGIPVIIRDIPVYEGWLEDGLNVYKFKEEKELKNMIQFVLENNDDAVTQRGRKVAIERDYGKIGDGLLHIYDEIWDTPLKDRIQNENLGCRR